MTVDAPPRVNGQHTRSAHFPVVSLKGLDQLVLEDAVFIALLAAIAVLRWQVITSLPEPTGVDGGNWLALGHSLLGSHSRSASIVYPPVVPLLTVGLAAIWGPFTGAQVLAMLSSLAPSAGTYVLLRRPLGIRAVILAGLVGLAATTSEAAAWGGYPQLLSLGFMALMLWAMDCYATTQRLRWAWVASLFLFLTLATNELIGAATVLIAGLFLVLRVRLAQKLDRPTLKRLGVAVIIGALPSVLLTPTYLALITGYLQNAATKASNQQLTELNLLSNFDNIFQDNPGFWYVMLLVAVFSPVILLLGGSRNRRRARLWFGRPLGTTATAILAPTLALLLLVRDVRFLYILPIAIAAGAGAWWSLLTNSAGRIASALDTSLVVVLSLVLLIESAIGMAAYQNDAEWYAALTPSEVSALQQLDRLAPHNAVLAVSPAAKSGSDQQGWPLGWWVEGLLDRPTYFASDLKWLNTADERRRAILANQLYDPSLGISSAMTLARAHHINFIIVATGWQGYRAWISTGGQLIGASEVIENDAIVVFAVGG